MFWRSLANGHGSCVKTASLFRTDLKWPSTLELSTRSVRHDMQRIN